MSNIVFYAASDYKHNREWHKKRIQMENTAPKEIMLSFTMKGQSLEQIEAALKKIPVGPETWVNHAHLHPRTVQRREWDMDLCEMLDRVFPGRQIYWNVGTYPGVDMVQMRKEMAGHASEYEIPVYIVGEVRDGVREEAETYEAYGLDCHYIDL